MMPGCDRELARVNLGLMIAAYLPAGILIAVREVELVIGLVIGLVTDALVLFELSAQAAVE
jgi:hypothetical protein